MRALAGARKVAGRIGMLACPRASPGVGIVLSQTLGYRPDVDGLRAVAITAVVAYHVGLPGLPGGFVGVDVFFVVSGFLLNRAQTKVSSR